MKKRSTTRGVCVFVKDIKQRYGSVYVCHHQPNLQKTVTYACNESATGSV